MNRLRTIRRPGIGYPLLPDNFTTAEGIPEFFSPGTPDATIMQLLQQQNVHLPASLASTFAAGQVNTTYVAPNTSPNVTSVNIAPGVWQWTRQDGTKFYGDVSGNPINYTPPPPTTSAGAAGSVATGASAAVTASGQPLSTQTGATVRVVYMLPVQGANGVYKYIMSDGSAHYADAAGNPVSYTPPATAPATTPAAGSQPTGVVMMPPAFLGPPVPAVTPSGGQISTTSGTPAPLTVDAGGVVNWLKGSMFGGLPNWLLVGGAALLLFTESGGTSRRR